MFESKVLTAKGAPVVFRKLKGTPKWRATAAAVSLALAAPFVHAAGLGKLSVQSALGQPLKASVEVTSVSRDEAASLAVKLASQNAFKQAGLDFNPALSALKFSLERKGESTYVVQITSLGPINEPFLDLLVELSWSTGRVLREYTVLLDPPALRQTPTVIPPAVALVPPSPQVAAPPVPAPTPAVVESAPPAPMPPVAATEPQLPPAPSPAAAPTPVEPVEAQTAPAVPTPPAPQPQVVSPRPEAKAATPVKPEPQAQSADARASEIYTVKPGDTLGKIASRNKRADVSLDQMLVALFRANPNAFTGENMNRLVAGRSITIPGNQEALAISQADARREVVAQSADFAQYRSRLAQASVAVAPAVETGTPGTAGQGKVTAKVEDRAAPARSGDQLKIAKSDTATGAIPGGSQKADEDVARQRALKEQQERAAALAKGNELANRALELQNKAAAQAQKVAEEKKAAEEKRLAAEKKAAEEKRLAEEKRAADLKAEQERKAAEERRIAEEKRLAEEKRIAEEQRLAQEKRAEEEKRAAEAKAQADAAQAQATATPVPTPAGDAAPAVQPSAAPTPAPVAQKPTPAAAPASAPAPSFLDELLGDTVTLLAIGGIGLLLVVLVVLNTMRRRRVENKEEFATTSENYRGNTFFGATGGQSVDTGATSVFNSSFIPAASQLDSNEVDPVAEADVYIAYGREEQAEDILKEALRVQPDRHPVRVKLLEIYSRRGDTASFDATFEELRVRTGGLGEDWERAVKLGRSMDPNNAAYASAAATAEATMRGPTSELRLNPSTKGPSTRGPATLGAMGSSAVADPFAASVPDAYGSGAPTVGTDSRMQDTAMTAETRLTPDTQSGESNAPAGPTTRFEATLGEIAPALSTDLASGNDQLSRTTTAIDFGSLDFDLGATKIDMPKTKSSEAPTVGEFKLPEVAAAPAPAPAAAAPATLGRIPDVDLSIPEVPKASEALGGTAALEEALSRPSLLGDVGALPGERAQRLTSNTDQATVPLIDFDLSGPDVELTGRRTETQAGTPLANQMATKLDLARGYIDLGVKDGARELLEEVMREGTREQRQSAVDLLKQVEA